jgi:hypothetical protein
MIKKILHFTLLILFPLLSLQAQENNISFGPKVGFNIGTPLPSGEISDDAEGKPIIGHNLGVYLNIPIYKNLNFQIEGSFNRKGAEFKTPVDSMEFTDYIQHPVYPDVVFEVKSFFNGIVEGAFDNFYLEIPVLLQYRISSSSKWRIEAGSYYAWLNKTNTHGKGTGTVGYDPAVREEDIDFTADQRHYDWGMLGGVSYTIGKAFFVNLRFSYGMVSIFKDNVDKIETRNLFSQFSLQYQFFPKNFCKTKQSDS